MIAQGAKRVLLREEEYVYDAHHFLLASVNLPVITQIIEASEEKPYLGLTLKIEQCEIAQAIDWLKGNFTQPFRADELAAHIGMSNSAFYHHFRALTSMSPLRFQKWMRLHEARRLTLTDRLDTATVAFQVVYQSPSQFSHEYRCLFGGPRM